MTIITGLGLLLLTLAAFSLFSMKAPKGSAAMSGMANAAVATFLVEAVHRYISGAVSYTHLRKRKLASGLK